MVQDDKITGKYLLLSEIFCLKLTFSNPINLDLNVVCAKSDQGRLSGVDCLLTRTEFLLHNKMEEEGEENFHSPEESPKSPTLLPWDRFSNWLHCACVVTFDLELGQAMEVRKLM